MDPGAAQIAVRDLRRLLIGPDYLPGGPGSDRWRRWRAVAVPVGLLALVGLGASAAAYLTENRELPPPLAVAVAYAGLAPVAIALPRPLLAWRLGYVMLFLGAVDAAPQESWPWNPVQIIGFLAVLLMAAGRADPGVTAWLCTLTLIPVFLLVPQANAFGVTVLMIAVLLAGDQIRRRRQSQRALAEQAEVSELEKARRAVLEERARIARELHDVVAHHMSMIAVQAETAPYRLGVLPEPARTEFTAIAGSARNAMIDMRRLLGVLRNESTGPSTAPQPGLADLPEVIEAARRAGMTVTLSGAGDHAPEAVELAAYRIVQEALANAARHAPGAEVRVALTEAGRDLTVRIDNDRGLAPAGGDLAAGHGLTGMRERARLLGGDFSAERTDGGGFAVVAQLPYDGEDHA